MEKKKGVVYSIPCMDCNSVYVGETGRNLEKRLKEHQYAVKRMDDKNGISVHAWTNLHRVNWNESRVLKMVPNYFHRSINCIEHQHHLKFRQRLRAQLHVDNFVYFILLDSYNTENVFVEACCDARYPIKIVFIFPPQSSCWGLLTFDKYRHIVWLNRSLRPLVL